jgi:hypothetical protein
VAAPFRTGVAAWSSFECQHARPEDWSRGPTASIPAHMRHITAFTQLRHPMRPGTFQFSSLGWLRELLRPGQYPGIIWLCRPTSGHLITLT